MFSLAQQWVLESFTFYHPFVICSSSTWIHRRHSWGDRHNYGSQLHSDWLCQLHHLLLPTRARTTWLWVRSYIHTSPRYLQSSGIQLFKLWTLAPTQGSNGTVTITVPSTRRGNQRLDVTMRGFCGNDFTVTRLFRSGVLIIIMLSNMTSSLGLALSQPLPSLYSAYISIIVLITTFSGPLHLSLPLWGTQNILCPYKETGEVLCRKLTEKSDQNVYRQYVPNMVQYSSQSWMYSL